MSKQPIIIRSDCYKSRLGQYHPSRLVLTFPGPAVHHLGHAGGLGLLSGCRWHGFVARLYTASGERREMGIVPSESCLRIILFSEAASVWFRGQ
jgi:hypothetical protein